MNDPQLVKPSPRNFVVCKKKFFAIRLRKIRAKPVTIYYFAISFYSEKNNNKIKIKYTLELEGLEIENRRYLLEDYWKNLKKIDNLSALLLKSLFSTVVGFKSSK